jgi:hypothetical protein
VPKDTQMRKVVDEYIQAPSTPPPPAPAPPTP